MSGIPIAAQPADRANEMGTRGANPLIWGLRVALVVALIDIGSRLINGYGFPEIPSEYYGFFQRSGVLYQPGRQSTGQIGQIVLTAGIVALAFGFAYLL